MKGFVLLLIGITSIQSGFTQSLKKERIEHLKRSVGQITIEGDQSTGTGFFIDAAGSILTCWHVIDPAIIKDSLGKVISVRKIFVTLVTGNKYEIQIPMIFFGADLNFKAVSNDFCLLFPVNSIAPNTINYLQLGTFEDIEEGDEVYTAGFPLGMPFPFVSKGILSVKYVDSSLVYQKAGEPDRRVKKSVALLDITINKGNSGGPIIKLADDISKDRVVGIANFLINPFGTTAERLNKELAKENIQLPSGLSLTEAMKLFSNAIIYSSNGISGCVSINHFLQAIK